MSSNSTVCISHKMERALKDIESHSLSTPEQSLKAELAATDHLSRNVRKAIMLSSKTLAATVPDRFSSRNVQYTVRVALSTELSNPERAAVWRIADDNMQSISKHSSLGWETHSKLEELFHRQSRFVIVHKCTDQDPDSSSAVFEAERIVAFTMFRFDREDDYDMIYCYELQIDREAQRQGLGKFLMQCLTQIGEKTRMEKIVLTALKSNKSALDFYYAAGFTMDPTSPDYEEDDESMRSSPDSIEDTVERGGSDDGAEAEECDYFILSRPIPYTK
ncbi:hypothetical protein K474DRAFT_1705122 [Panus rudis PR-1116 ss-1]|nr:hypothetical protein K474DRAFT_1705122 [Panus rudis PR-1116 ss-1]